MINDFVKSLIKWKNKLCNTYAKNGHPHLQEATNLVLAVIAKRKQDYHGNLALRLNNQATSAKKLVKFKNFLK